MKTAVVTLRSSSPYSQSRMHRIPKGERESHEALEQRTWIEKGHWDEHDEMYVPPMAFKMALDSAAKKRKERIPGKGTSTYTSHFKGGILVLEPPRLGVFKKDIQDTPFTLTTSGCSWVPCNADGVRGSGKRVMRAFPTVAKWQTKVTFHIVDEVITEKVFEDHLRDAGRFTGIGQFRPENGGYYGRFEIVGIEWQKN